jgi:hypothetical protein
VSIETGEVLTQLRHCLIVALWQAPLAPEYAGVLSADAFGNPCLFVELDHEIFLSACLTTPVKAMSPELPAISQFGLVEPLIAPALRSINFPFGLSLSKPYSHRETLRQAQGERINRF